MTLDFRAFRKIPWRQDGAPDNFITDHVFYGADPGGNGFQVAVARLAPGKSAPTSGNLRALHAFRQGRGITPLVVVVTDGTLSWLIGPAPDQITEALHNEQAQRYLQSVLDEPGRQAAYNRLIALRRSVNTTMVAGLTNSGLFASYHLRENVRQRPDWEDAQLRSRQLLTKRGQSLIQALGFMTTPATGGAQILSGTAGNPQAVAVLLDESEHFEARSPRFQLTPVAFGLRIAMNQGIPWLVVLRKDQIRLYPGKDGVGVGQKGQTETFLELDLAALDSDYAALLSLVFSAEALSPDGTTRQLLDDSSRFANSLGERLRDRIYEDVMPPLAKEVAGRLVQLGHTLSAEGLARAYRVTLHILFRLLFQAYAEDRGLLPSGRNELYDAHSLKAVAQQKITLPEDGADSYLLWDNLSQVWHAINHGNPQWQVPAYNGGLFAADGRTNPEGALLTEIRLSDSVMYPVLMSLLVDAGEDGTHGPLDFRSLSVREFGTIYEGLLESALSVATTDLTTDQNGFWVSASPGDEVLAPAGTVYFHSASGERKATGSYFTPKIIVDHLIERSVTPVLEAHLKKVAGLLIKGDLLGAERLFFDFRVADLAMGSGHFLVAVVDKIEALMRNFLDEHSLPSVQNELLRLSRSAIEALGNDEVAKTEIDDVVLLRRQVARRCIYGLDINPMATELARLAIWIHTFVPGLPMSNLDHGLVCANSLTGIGTVDEVFDVFLPSRDANRDWVYEVISSTINQSLESARERLLELANASEANKAEVKAALKLIAQAKVAAEPARRIFDAAVAIRTGRLPGNVAVSVVDAETLSQLIERPEIDEIHEELTPAHMPYLFPEVFLRDRPGFDVLIGNPPWEKIKIEEHQWWGLRIPRLRSMPQRQRNEALRQFQSARPDLMSEYQTVVNDVNAYRAAILSGPYAGIGAGGDPDLYQAFAWRNWHLVRNEGKVAFVVPRMAMSGSNLTPWRKDILEHGSFTDVCFLTNTGEWIFENVDGRYTIALATLTKGGEHVVRVTGPFYSSSEFQTNKEKLTEIGAGEFRSWSNNLAFPLTPDSVAIEIVRVLKRNPRFAQAFSDFEFRPVAELHATGDRHHFDVDLSNSAGRIPVLKGASFNLWDPDFGEPFAYADSNDLRTHLTAKLANQMRNSRSAYHGMSYQDGTLPLDRARIAFRDVTNRTNTRTMISCLLPPNRSATHKAPLLVIRAGDENAEAFLLGVMSSIPFDWQARLTVELNFTFEILNDLTVPRYVPDNALCQRVVEISGRLAAVDDRYSDWASAVGVPVGTVTDPAQKEDLVAELDALVSLLYGLSEQQVEHVFATFHRGWNYHARLSNVLRHFHRWRVQT